MSTTDDLLKRYPIITDQVDANELRVILTELERTLRIGTLGAVVELGCYEGTTSLFIRRLLDRLHDQRPFHVYDSFAGLPVKSTFDNSPAGTQFTAGALHADKRTFIRNFKSAGLELPVIHKRWFHELTDSDVPELISFAFLDGDFYDSINDSFRAIESKLAPQAVIIVDDYQSEALPGARRATDEWVKRHPSAALRTQASLAVIHT